MIREVNTSAEREEQKLQELQPYVQTCLSFLFSLLLHGECVMTDFWYSVAFKK